MAPLQPCNMLGGAPIGWDKGWRAKSPQDRIVGPACVSSGQAVLTSGLLCVRNYRRSFHGSTLILITLCCISGHRLKSLFPNNFQDVFLEGEEGEGRLGSRCGGGSIVLSTPGVGFVGCQCGVNDTPWLRLRVAQTL